MPVCVEKRGKKYRVVDCGNRKITMNKAGTPADGGGHDSRSAAMRQARAINASMES